MKKFRKYILMDQPDDIDALDIAICPVQTEEHNAEYKKWRTRSDNIFGFSGKKSQKLHTYIDGMGMVDNGVEARETKALKNVCFLVTIAAIIYALVDNVLIVPLMLLFNILGVEISYSFHESIAYGNQYAVLAVQMIQGILKLILPLIFLHKKLDMPNKIALPMKILNARAVVETMCLACVGFYIVSLLRCILPVEVLAVENIGMTFRVADYMNGGCVTIFFLLEFLIVPVLTELLFHGALLKAMCQFGAGYAILFIAAINTILMHDPASFAMIFITSFAAGIGVWKTGSVVTGIIIQAKMRLLGYLLFKCEDLPDIFGIPSVYICITVVLTEALMGILLLYSSKEKSTPFVDYHTFIHIKEKAKISIWGSSMLAVWVLCAILMIIEIVM